MDEFKGKAFEEEFFAIQQRVEQARLRVLLREAQISTHETVQRNIETWNAWAEMVVAHRELAAIYNQALKDWGELTARHSLKLV